MSTRAIAARTVAAPAVAAVPAVRLDAIGGAVARWGVIVTLVAIGALKFTTGEAEGIRRLVETSPLLAWLYAITDVCGASALIGVAELVAAAGMIAGRRAPRLAVLGSAIAVATFLTTLSFLLTAPGAWDDTLGGPARGGTGQFVIKDLVLLGASLQSLAGAIAARRAATAH